MAPCALRLLDLPQPGWPDVLVRTFSQSISPEISRCQESPGLEATDVDTLAASWQLYRLATEAPPVKHGYGSILADRSLGVIDPEILLKLCTRFDAVVPAVVKDDPASSRAKSGLLDVAIALVSGQAVLGGSEFGEVRVSRRKR